MNFINVKDFCYYFHSVVNIGYVHIGDKGVLIDAGLDSGSMKKVLKKLDECKLPVTHLFITHSHADHYGGAAYLQKVKDVITVAPFLEEAILRNPVLEPLYLFQGTKPLPEMRNKFMEGPEVRIDHTIQEGKHSICGVDFEAILFPGHSEYQLGYLINDILYCGDAYFGIEQLKKHKIPFIVDAEDTLQSLEKIKTIPCFGVIPGHGQFEENITETVEANCRLHNDIVRSMEELLEKNLEGISHESLIREMCKKWDVTLPHLSSWMLYRTAITAYATKLVKDNKAQMKIKNYTLWLEKNEEKA